MANASKNHMGAASQGKRDGSGAMTDLPEGILPDNMVLSNRDKSRHSDERGLAARLFKPSSIRITPPTGKLTLTLRATATPAVWPIR